MKIGLVFTLGVSLQSWVVLGLFDREKLIYERMLNSETIDEVVWFTYGGDDKRYQRYLKKGITIVSMPKIFRGKLGEFLYSFCMPLLHGRYFRRVTLIKTNQMRGSWSAVIASFLYRKALVVRTGYTWSIFAKKNKKIASLDRLARFFETVAYKAAHAAVVSSVKDAEYIRQNYGIAAKKVYVIGNYIDVDSFKPEANTSKFPDRIVFVGRLNQQKNLKNLIQAIAGLPYRLDIYYHDGNLKDELEVFAAKCASNTFFMGSVRNSQLGAVLNKYQLFVLPSLYEGMPKALLEAMSCGLAVLGTNVQGINEVVKHGVTGWLVERTDVESIKKGIATLMSKRELREALGRAARAFVEREFSLSRITGKEIHLYSVLGAVGGNS